MTGFDFDWAVTHSTVFHADDVFGMAFCRLLNPDIEIIRTLDVDTILGKANIDGKKAIVFDIGLGKYDHHQADKAVREDGSGVPYCGFGLLWRDYGYLLCPDKDAWKKVDQTLVVAIDSADNGVAQNLLSASIKVFNPAWNSPASEDSRFLQAMHIAESILKAFIEKANAEVLAKDEVIACCDGTEVLVLDRFLPWQDTVISDPRTKDILFVVFPSKRGGWNVQTVPKQIGTYDNRVDFPEEWLGHEDPDRGITFAHTGNFLIACKTKQQAIAVAKEAVELSKNSSVGAVYSI